jgi:hypothetical protein
MLSEDPAARRAGPARIDGNPRAAAWQPKATVVVVVVGVGLGAVLFGGLVPGLHPNFAPPEYVEFEGKMYYVTTIVAPSPPFGSNVTAPEEEFVHNATFWVWGTTTFAGFNTFLDGNASVSGGHVYTFSLGGRILSTNRTTQFVSPGGTIAVLWTGGVSAQLLVLAS